MEVQLCVRNGRRSTLLLAPGKVRHILEGKGEASRTQQMSWELVQLLFEKSNEQAIIS